MQQYVDIEYDLVYNNQFDRNTTQSEDNNAGERREQNLSWVKAQGSRHVHLDIAVMHLVKSP